MLANFILSDPTTLRLQNTIIILKEVDSAKVAHKYWIILDKRAPGYIKFNLTCQ
jgi:hypothetical protein